MALVSADGYGELLAQLKEQVRQARRRAGLAVNRELVLLYWSLGREILVHQQQRGWGARVVDQLASDLRREFPEMTGLSPRNLKYMRAFAEAWPDEAIVQQVAAQLPWFHHCVLLEGDFHPEYAGKMSFYLSAVDDLLRHPDDDRSIGLILCKSNNRIIAEYTLRDTHQAMGISTYQLGRPLPEALREALPDVAELQARLQSTEEPDPE